MDLFYCFSIFLIFYNEDISLSYLGKKSGLNVSKNFKILHDGQNKFTNKMNLLLNMSTL